VPPFRNVFRFKENGIPLQENLAYLTREKGKEREVIDIDMLSDDDSKPCRSSPAAQSLHLSATPATMPSNSAQPQSQILTTNGPALPTQRANAVEDLFAKRPPTSPLPPQSSPRKPRPPARTGSSRPFLSTPHPARSGQYAGRSDSEDDPLSLTYTSSPELERDLSLPTLNTNASTRGKRKQKQANIDATAVSSRQQAIVGSSRSPQPPQPQKYPPSKKGRTSSRSSTSAKLKRGLTLDEELRDALDTNDGDEDGSGIFMGVGTRSKRLGFLAHGGAGGTPVFMSEGYVEDVEKVDEAQKVYYGDGVTFKYEDEDEIQEVQPEEDDNENQPRTMAAMPSIANTAAAKRRGRR
jgi:hypothetical protein